MSRLAALFCAMLLQAVATAQPAGAPASVENSDEKPRLVLETQGFTSQVLDLAFSPDGRLLAAAGSDRVVRIWEVETQELKFSLRGQSGIGIGGTCHAVAFSPDGRQLVVGVLDSTTEGTIRVYETADLNQVAQLLPAHPTGGTLELAFGADGRHFASVGEDGEVLFWDWPTRRQIGRAATRGRIVYFGFPTKLPILVAVDDDGLHYWSAPHARDLATLNLAQQQALGGAGAIQSARATSEAMFATLARLDRTWPFGGRERASYLAPEAGLVVVAGQGKEGGLDKFWAGVWSLSDGRPFARHDTHRFTPSAVALSPDRSLVASADVYGEVQVWEAASGRDRFRLAGQGSPVYRVGFLPSGKGIAIGTRPSAGADWNFNHYAEADRLFDVENRSLTSKIPEPPLFEVTRQGGRSLSIAQDVARTAYTLSCARDGRLESRFPLAKGVIPMCYSFLKSKELGCDDPLVMGLQDNQLVCFEPTRMLQRRDFLGHTGAVHAVSESPDGHLLVTGSADRVIRFFSLREVKEIAQPDFAVYSDAIVHHVIPGGQAERAGVQLGDKYLALGDVDVATLSELYITGRWPFRVGQQLPLDMERAGRRYRTSVTLVPMGDFVEPILSLFIAGDEWVLWTPQGYYDASLGGDRLIGWHVNRGRPRAAKFYLSHQFRKQFYRPDVIDLVLRTGDVAEAVAQAEGGRTRPAVALDLRNSEDLKRIEPPAVRIIEPPDGARSRTGRITARAEVTSQNGLPIGEVRVLVNGRPAAGELKVEDGATPTRRVISQEVELPADKTELAVVAANREASSQPVTVVVHTRRKAVPPKVFLLAIGISEYTSREIETLKFAHKDAESFMDAWAPQSGRFYGAIETRLLPNSRATAANIRDGLQWLADQVGPNDRAMLFVSAHGVLEKRGQEYFLGTHEIDPNRLRATGIPASEVVKLIASLPCKTLIFVDTCHSGGLGSKLVGDPLRDLSSEDVGAVLFASSVPRERSLENDSWGHGAFAKAILDTFADPASDLNRDGRLSVTELDYQIDQRVRQLTDDRQHPATHKPSNVPNFDILSFKKN